MLRPARFGALGAALLCAGVVDFIVGRLLLGSLPAPPRDGLPRPDALDALRHVLERPASFSHALVAVLALTLNCMAIAAALRDATFAPPARRLTLLVLSVFALPVIALSLALPIRPQVIFMALTATAFVGMVCAINTSFKALGGVLKLAIWLLSAPILLGYLDTLTRLVPWLSGGAWSGLAGTVELATEACVVLSGIVAPFALIAPEARRRLTAPLVMAALIAAVPTLAFSALAVLAWPETQSLASRSVGLELAVPYAQPLYVAALFGYVLTAAFHLWPRRHPGGATELGLGLCALLFGGCATYTPFRISLLMLGLLLLALGVHRPTSDA